MPDWNVQLGTATSNAHELTATVTTTERHAMPDPLTPAADLREALAGLVRIVEEWGIKWGGDWACSECHPESDMLADGWRCALHRARRILAIEQPTRATADAEVAALRARVEAHGRRFHAAAHAVDGVTWQECERLSCAKDLAALAAALEADRA